MNILFILLSFYGLTFLLKDSYILEKPRLYLMAKYVWFHKLMSCSFCVGFHSGWIVYLLTFTSFSFRTLFICSLVSAALNLIIAKIEEYYVKD